jgi:hypothetical protein
MRRVGAAILSCTNKNLRSSAVRNMSNTLAPASSCLPASTQGKKSGRPCSRQATERPQRDEIDTETDGREHDSGRGQSGGEGKIQRGQQ